MRGEFNPNHAIDFIMKCVYKQINNKAKRLGKCRVLGVSSLNALLKVCFAAIFMRNVAGVFGI
jgi:hypothetical protein